MRTDKRILGTIVILTLTVALFGCNKPKDDLVVVTEKYTTETTAQGSSEQGGSTNTTNTPAQAENETDYVVAKADPVTYTVIDGLEIKKSSYDQQIGYSVNNDTIIKMNGDDVTVEGNGVAVSGRKIVIQTEGTYILRGNLTNGQIYVHVAEDEKVQLVLDNATIGCEFSAPIYCDQADKVVITLVSGSENAVKDYLSGTDASAKGCIFSNCDLTINGEGSLIVDAAFRHGIVSDKDLKIVSGTITVNAAEIGLKGKKSIAVFGGDVTVTAGEDAMKSNREETGFIFVTDATISLTAEDDGLQAEQCIVLRNADVKVRCFGDVVNCDGITEGTDSIVRWN